MALSRRDLIGGSLAAAVVTGSGLTGAKAGPPDLDVALIGGGVSCAYIGWRLTSDPAWRGKRIGLFELSDRIGGRLFSPTMSAMPHLPVELGGMRYVITKGGTTVTERLIDHLQFDTTVAPAGGSENLFYLRGKRFRAKDITNPAVVPYNLPRIYSGRAPIEILLAQFRALVPDAMTLSPAQWTSVKKTVKFHDLPLNDSSLLDVLSEPIRTASRTIPSNEVFEFVKDGLGYNVLSTPTNLGEAMPWIIDDFVNTQGYRTIRAGMQALPLELTQRFKQAGGQIALGMKLNRIDMIPDGTYALNFIAGRGDKHVRVTAACVILGLPPRSISLLDRASVMFQAPGFVADLQAVAPNNMTKIFVGFDQPWWRNSPLGLRNGRSVSDLPLRQTYYFGTEGEQPGADPTNHRSLMMASYDDGFAYQFWSSFPKGDPLGGGPFWTMRPEMTREVLRELEALHGVPVPAPYAPDATMLVDWGADPYGGAIHTWNIGQRSAEVMPRIRKPTAGPLFICGEAWSTDQGWINGALQTSEHVLQDHLGTAPPAWLPSSVPLGA